MKAWIELEFNLPEEKETYEMYMQAPIMHSALWKIQETFHNRSKRAETNCELHEEVYELICNIIEEYDLNL